ncbi:MAG: hypothetical protein ACE5GW_10320 [Planctomycetota bacterium]
MSGELHRAGRLPRPEMATGGFTLMELIVGVTVTVGVIASAYLCMRAGFESKKLVEARADALQKARVALALLGADLRSACPLSPESPLAGMDRELGEIEADNIDFATHNWSPAAPGEGDFIEVSWFIDRNEETGEPGLWRRRDTTPDDEPFAGGFREEIAPGIHGFRLEYSDGYSWYDEWGDDPDMPTSTIPGGSGFASTSFGLPDAVRITIAFSEGKPGRQDEATGSEEVNEEARPLVFQTVVHLNLAARTAPDFGGGDYGGAMEVIGGAGGGGGL